MLTKHQPRYTQHNKIELVRGGSRYFDLLENLIRSAQSTLYFQIYIFDDDATGKRIAAALIDAARRKVKVYLLLDAYASQSLPNVFIRDLKDSGINFRWFKPIVKGKKFFLGRRMHHKIVVADNIHSLVGGLNISNRYNDIGGNIAWLDWAVYATGDVSAALGEVCRKRMKGVSLRYKKRSEIKETLTPVHVDECDVRVLVNDKVMRKSQITRCYLQMLKEAKSHVIIMSPYFLPGYQIRRRIKLAAKRGVKIQVILAGVSDIPLAKYAERFMYDWLFKNNIEIFEYQRTVLHGKIATSDGHVTTVGSYNVNNLSAYLSIELNLEIKDKTFTAKVENQLNEIITLDCLPITEAVYKNQVNAFTRFLQRIAYNIFRLLFYVFTFRMKNKE